MAKAAPRVEEVRAAGPPCYPPDMIPTGLLGGSFNPAHMGHRRLSLAALDRLELAEIWWLVSPGNPLKDKSDMAPLGARFASARRMSRRARIRPTAIEADLGTIFTVDTLDRLRRLYPRRQFIWLMGEDNLAGFHLWRDWRRIARMVPIAVVTRPGYHGAALTAPAMGWLRRFVRPATDASNWTKWRLPSLVLLDMPPDPTSATALRASNPRWHDRDDQSFNPESVRDGVTRRRLVKRRPFARTRTRSAR